MFDISVFAAARGSDRIIRSCGWIASKGYC
jgi:hypothetical protein